MNLAEKVREVRDWPQPGVGFKDVTPLLADPKALDYTIAQLAEIPNVAAVKQANADLEQARFIAQDTRLDLYAGDDNLVFPFLAAYRPEQATSP